MSGVEFGAPPRSTVHLTLKVETAGGGQEEEEGDVKANEERDPGVEHEGNGDYEAGSSPAKGGVKGKRKDKGKGKVRRPKGAEVAPPPPADCNGPPGERCIS